MSFTSSAFSQLDLLCLSVSPKGTTRSPLDGFSLNLILRDFSKVCRENRTFIKIYQWLVLYMKTCVHLWYVAEFFLEWEMFQTKVVEKIKTHFMLNKFFSENRAVYEIMWKNMVERDRPQIRRMRVACWIRKATNIHSQYVTLITFPQQQWLHGRA